MNHRAESTSGFLAETFAPRRAAAQMESEARRLRLAAESLASAGALVRYVESIFLPGEETALHLFEAQRIETVEQALRDAALDADRISLVVTQKGSG